MTAIGRKADELPKLRTHAARGAGTRSHSRRARGKAGRERVRHPRGRGRWRRSPTDHGGFKIYDISDRSKPKLIAHQRTHGLGVHRFDMDANYAYISTEMPGYIGNILVIYDIRNPAKPEEVSTLVDAGPAPRGRREADVAGPPAPPASRAAPGRHDVGRLLARRRAHHRRVRHPQAARRSAPTTITRRSRSPRTRSWAFPTINGRKIARRDRRGRPRAQRRRDGEAPRPPARVPVGVRHDRPRRTSSRSPFSK